jgi:SAM-dependent methyltransferase
VDYSTALLAIGKRNACRRRYPVQFVQADARRPGLTDGVFDHVMILGNSLGYLVEPNADLRILRECRRLLKTGGWLLLDVTDGDAVRSQSPPVAWHEIGDEVVVCRRREVAGRCVRAREMVLSKTRGLIRDQTYRIRLYAADELTELVSRAGFGELRLVPDASVLDRTRDLGCMNHRLVVVARKA